MNEKRTILVISHSPGLGGAERSLLETLYLLAPLYKIHLISPGEGDLMHRVLRKDAAAFASVHKVPFYFNYYHYDTPLWRKIYWYFFNQIAHRKIVAIAREIKPDAVYSNSVASWQGADCAQALNLPHVWHLRELILMSSIGQPLPGRKALLSRITAGDTVFLSNSRYVAEWYHAEFGIKPKVAYQPVTASVTSKLSQSPNLRLLSVGRLHFEKRHHLAIQAVARLPQHLRQRICLKIFGKGPELHALQAMIEREDLSAQVHLKGYTENLLEEISQSDIVLSTSVGEPFGRVTAEALLAGCPVIGVDSGGTAELLGNGNKRGTLVPLDDPGALSDAISSFAQDPDPSRERAVDAAKWARRTLAPDRYLDVVRTAFDEAILKKQRYYDP